MEGGSIIVIQTQVRAQGRDGRAAKSEEDRESEGACAGGASHPREVATAGLRCRVQRVDPSCWSGGRQAAGGDAESSEWMQRICSPQCSAEQGAQDISERLTTAQI